NRTRACTCFLSGLVAFVPTPSTLHPHSRHSAFAVCFIPIQVVCKIKPGVNKT
uniref:Uncharacterized protein n=1 Tax=Anopheles minimus TaxID=112268 RepID=A0A182WPL8_9DIPT